jgi:hypothetical protein
MYGGSEALLDRRRRPHLDRGESIGDRRKRKKRKKVGWILRRE